MSAVLLFSAILHIAALALLVAQLLQIWHERQGGHEPRPS